MKISSVRLLSGCLVLGQVLGLGHNDDGLDGVRALAQRQIPKHSTSFLFEKIDGSGDAFVLSDANSSSPRIKVGCTTVSACSRGLYTYLTKFGNVDISWTGSTFNRLPSKLPSVGTSMKGSAIVPYRYHFNTVTFGYTTVFYNFNDWSHLLDWMALKGINLPLSWVGYEYILLQVFREIGLSDDIIFDFLSGAAFQPWNRFGNIQGSWGGPLPQQWINDQFALQKRLVARMAELGMTPVLPCFTGFVPRHMVNVFPNATIGTSSQWAGFPTNLTEDKFLDPFDPLYARIQTSFITKQREAYGDISHIYTLDQYNEIDPISGDPEYLRNVSSNTFRSLRAADPNAVWFMQAWLFLISEQFWTLDRVEAYLGGVEDPEGMIILDLHTESQPQWQRLDSYFNKTWIWCSLHDFGGNMGLEGNLFNVTAVPIEALNTPGSSMKGVGSTMEGQEGNEIVYDILLDQAWSSTPLDLDNYISAWASHRYSLQNLPDSAVEAWLTLGTTVYNNTDSNILAVPKGLFELTPALTGIKDRQGNQPTALFYETNTSVVPALNGFLAASKKNPHLLNSAEFAHDVIDVSRQLLANRFIDAYDVVISTYNSNSSSADDIASAGKPLLAILSDLDEVLLTNRDFLLSRWIKSARDLAGDNVTYADYLEYNARNQITLWGPTGQINDYASKQWGGLVGTYYLPRWKMFIDYLQDIMTNGTEFDTAAFNTQILNFGIEWDERIWGQGKGETWGTVGNTWEVVKKTVEKYL